MLEASDAGKHALLVADTGAGKTLAGFLPTLADFTPSRLGGAEPPDGLHTLYISPLKALAHDVQRNLVAPVEEMGLPIRIETRSGVWYSFTPDHAGLYVFGETSGNNVVITMFSGALRPRQPRRFR